MDAVDKVHVYFQEQQKALNLEFFEQDCNFE